jgi:hypothetical protein
VDLETQTRMQLLQLERALETLEGSLGQESNGKILAAAETLRQEQSRLHRLNQALRLVISLQLQGVIQASP